jgi:hypothetical protein
MQSHLKRSITVPLRGELTWAELWESSDKGLILCWERGRQKRIEIPDVAARAEKGELVTLPWKGGTENVDDKTKTKNQVRFGTLKYLAMWQGIRGEDLDISFTTDTFIVCTKSKRAVTFREEIPILD